MIVRGELLSDNVFHGDFLVGHGGNFLMAKYQPYLYKNLWRGLIHVNSRHFNRNSLVIGRMGSGKSNLLKYVVASFPSNRFIIHDVKGEYVAHFYEEGDVILNHLDARGVVWDVIRDCKSDSMLARSILYNMVSSYNKGKDGEFWTVKAVEVLQDLIREVPLAEPDLTAVAIYEWHKKKSSNVQGETFRSSFAVAQPVIQTLLDMYYVAHVSKRPLLSLDEILSRRRIFLVFLPEFAKPLSIVNQGFLSACFSRYLSREDTKDFKDFAFFILDEYLTFNFELQLEKQVLTLARSKGMCLFLGMQFLPVDSKDRLSLLLNSRQFTFVFRVDAPETAKVLAESSGILEYTREVASFSGGFSLTNDNVGVNAQVLRTYTVPEEVFMQLPEHVCYLEANTESGKARTFVKPVWYDLPEKNRGFIRDGATVSLKSL